MEQIKTAQSGTLESNDIMITITRANQGSGVQLELQSIVMEQYGEEIKKVILSTLESCHVKDLLVHAVDRGALDCTIEARLLTALSRLGYVINIMEGRMA